MTFNVIDFLTGLFDEAAAPASIDHATADPLFPLDLLAVLRSATVLWVGPDDDDHDADTGPRWNDAVDAAEVSSCPTCPRLMTWQDALGRWRCLTCDPPTRSRRLADRADRLRHLAALQGSCGEEQRGLPANDLYGNSRYIAPNIATQADSRIIADPVTICPRCESGRVLRELQAMTGGVCWSCHLAAAPTEKGDIPAGG